MLSQGDTRLLWIAQARFNDVHVISMRVTDGYAEGLEASIQRLVDNGRTRRVVGGYRYWYWNGDRDRHGDWSRANCANQTYDAK